MGLTKQKNYKNKTNIKKLNKKPKTARDTDKNEFSFLSDRQKEE